MSAGASSKHTKADAKPVLEPEEIDALMANMGSDEHAEAMFVSLPPMPQPKSVEAFEFNGQDESGPARYPLFMNVQERLSESLSEQWSDIFKREVSIALGDSCQKQYQDIISEESPRVYFAFEAEGHGRMMLTVDIILIVAYVDAMLGGSGETYGDTSETLSPVEQRLAGRIASSFERILEEVWEPVHQIDFELFKIDTDPQFLAVAGSSDECFSTDYDIKLDEQVGGTMSVYYPRSFLEPILDLLRSTANDEAVAVDEEWESELQRAMQSVPLSISVEMGQCSMDIARFLDLSPGDLLPLKKGETEPSMLRVGSMPMFDVVAGNQNGKLAVEIISEKKHGGAS